MIQHTNISAKQELVVNDFKGLYHTLSDHTVAQDNINTMATVHEQIWYKRHLVHPPNGFEIIMSSEHPLITV